MTTAAARLPPRSKLAAPMLPRPFRVVRIRRDLSDTFTLELADAASAAPFPFAAGQFNMLYVFGAGEVAISISGNPAAPERLVHTERFDRPWYPGEAVITTTLDEREGRTTLTATQRYQSRAARDLVLGSPMEDRVAESYDKLAELLR